MHARARSVVAALAPARAAHGAIDGRIAVFPITARELATVPGVTPPIHFHSLLGTAYPRYREWITFHCERVYPEYLIAYQRCKGDNHQPV